MKLQYLISTFYLLITLLVCPALATTTLNGEIKLDERLSTNGSRAINWDQATMDLKINSALSDDVAAYAEFRFRTWGSSLETELREAYINLYGWPLKNIDLRAGKQRIAWGTADKLNQLDNINPYDFRDMLEFGEKIPTNAIKLTGYFGENTLTVVAVPGFTPAMLPASYLTGYLSRLTPPGMTVTTIESSTTLPAAQTDNSQFGLKFARNIIGYDMSLSYYHGWDSVPNLSNLILTPASPTALTAKLVQNYNKLSVIGYDIAGSVNDIGIWGEWGLFTPEDATTTIVTPAKTTTTEVKPYLKSTIGLDYTWENGFYLNAQWMHGFFNERGDALGNYGLVRLEKGIWDDKAKLSLTYLAEYDNKVVASMFGPGINFYPADATEIELLLLNIEAESTAKLAHWSDLDQFCLRFKYSF